MKPRAILFGPFVGEMYWECGRFAPMLPYYKYKKYKGQDIKYIILTREERFDMYGCYADIFVPLRIEGDYIDKCPNCFRLDGYSIEQYQRVAKNFRRKYEETYEIVEHVYPNIDKRNYVNKNQYNNKYMIFDYKPRIENYNLVNEYLPKNDKPLIIIAPRYRKGFKRNWGGWQEFYDLIERNSSVKDYFNIVICGKKGEYIPDEKHRFLDMAEIQLGSKSSTIGILLALMEKAVFVFGSQSAIPNIALLYGVEVLEFGCQKTLHTKTYNIKNTPITFIENKSYDIQPRVIFEQFKKLVFRKRLKN